MKLIARCVCGLGASALILVTLTSTDAATATFTAGLAQTRFTTAAEVAGGAPFLWIVHQFLVTTDADILDVRDVSIQALAHPYNHQLGTDNSPPNLALVTAFPALGADSWITTPGPTLTAGAVDLFGTPGATWFDTSNDGPQTIFVFAQLTIPPNIETGSFLTAFTFSGVLDLNGGNGAESFPFQFHLLGDYNDDRVIDAADYTVWRDRLGQAAALPNDDTAGVGPDDYNRWVDNFGQSSLGSGSGGIGSTSVGAVARVPEPATSTLVVLGVGIAFAFWRTGPLCALRQSRDSFLRFRRRHNSACSMCASLRPIAPLLVAWFMVAGPTTDFSFGATWNSTAGGNYDVPGNWAGGVPNAPGAVADFSTLNPNGDISITLNADVVLGSLLFGDIDNATSPSSWDLRTDNLPPAVITLDGNGVRPVISVDPLGPTGSGFDDAYIEVGLAGSMGFSKRGDGILTLDNPFITVSGDIEISAGILRLKGTFLDDQSDVLIAAGAILELDYSSLVMDDVRSLYLGGVPQPPGVYGVGALGAAFFKGAGKLNVMTLGPPLGIPGDYNDDRVIDAADYTVWRDRLGQTAALPNDDTAGVGPDDYTRWKNNFGTHSGAASGGSAIGDSLAANHAVPEPSTATLLLMAALLGVAPFHRGLCAPGCPA